MRTEAVLSNADTIQDDDKFIDVKVVYHITVNKSAYEREYDEGPVSVRDLKEDVRIRTFDHIENGSYFPHGILHDLVME